MPPALFCPPCNAARPRCPLPARRIRSAVGSLGSTGWSYAAIPLIWIFMLLIRAACLAAFNPLFRAVGEREFHLCIYH